MGKKIRYLTSKEGLIDYSILKSQIEKIDEEIYEKLKGLNAKIVDETIKYLLYDIKIKKIYEIKNKGSLVINFKANPYNKLKKKDYNALIYFLNFDERSNEFKKLKKSIENILEKNDLKKV